MSETIDNSLGAPQDSFVALGSEGLCSEGAASRKYFVCAEGGQATFDWYLDLMLDAWKEKNCVNDFLTDMKFG